MNCLSWPSDISTTPVVVAERAAPILIRYKRLVPGSGGDGTHWGRLGQETLVELGADRWRRIAAVAVFREQAYCSGTTGRRVRVDEYVAEDLGS